MINYLISLYFIVLQYYDNIKCLKKSLKITYESKI